MNTEDLRRKIKDIIQEKGLKITSIERASGLSRDVLRNFLCGKVKEPKLEMIDSVIKVLGIEIKSFLDDKKKTVPTEQCQINLLKECFDALQQDISEKKLTLSLDNFFQCLKMIYEYHQENNISIDQNFVRWCVKKQI